MLSQLWSYWIEYTAGAWSTWKLDLEISVWISQHQVDADDLAFSLAWAMRRHILATVG